MQGSLLLRAHSCDHLLLLLSIHRVIGAALLAAPTTLEYYTLLNIREKSDYSVEMFNFFFFVFISTSLAKYYVMHVCTSAADELVNGLRDNCAYTAIK